MTSLNNIVYRNMFLVVKAFANKFVNRTLSEDEAREITLKVLNNYGANATDNEIIKAINN